jgi:hypothetical protein
VFDECRLFIGWNVAACPAFNPDPPVTRNPGTIISEDGQTQQLTVNAFPNPFRKNVRFVIKSPVSGQAQLEVFNIVGQRIQVAYEGHLQAGVSQVVDFKVPGSFNGTMIYKLKVGNQLVTGKLVSIE